MSVLTNRLRGETPIYAVPAIAFLLVAASFLVQGRVGLNLADEGFLWYGSMRVLLGDVPLRDFQSYDPGRYYWSAFWMWLLGSDGIMAVRLSAALFQACGLAAGLLVLRRILPGSMPLFIAALVLLLWFFPRHKLFDLSLAIWAVYVGTALIEHPTVLRHFLAGLFIGLAAFFGRNHGFYAFLALSCIALFAWFRLDRTRVPAKLLAWFGGLALGYLPMFYLAITQPGFLSAVLDGVLFLFRTGATNLAVPVPWPWAVEYRLPWQWAVHRFAVGATFLAMPVLYAVGALIVLREKRPGEIRRQSVFVASVAVGIFYMHYAFARADVGHLAHAIYPFLFALLAFPGVPQQVAWGRAAIALPLALFGYSIFAAALASPLYPRFSQRNFVEIDVRGDKLIVDPGTARIVRTVQSIAQIYMRPDERIVFAPDWPAMYGVLGRQAPVWGSYFLFPNDIQGQRRFTEELERGQVVWAVIGNATLDGREDLRFSNSHPMIWQYLADNYDPVEIQGLPADYRLLRRRAVPAPRADAKS